MNDEFPIKGDIGRAFEKGKGQWFYAYRGVNWEKVPTGWKWGEVICRNRQEMDSLINQREQFLQNSLNKKK